MDDLLQINFYLLLATTALDVVCLVLAIIIARRVRVLAAQATADQTKTAQAATAQTTADQTKTTQTKKGSA